jgi:predicted Zn-dependent peptidase
LFVPYAAGAQSPAFPPPIQEDRLANGLRVVLAPDDSVSDVSLVVRYEAGHGDDPDGREGLAHVTEHVVFGAFRHGAHAKLLLQAGATNLNAHTSFDATWFEETVPPEALDLALWLEGARMATATDDVDEAEVVRERTVAGHEYRQYGGGHEFGWLFELEFDELFPEWHPYHFARDALGALDRIRPTDVRAFARTWYGPNNASLVLAGRFDAGRALDLVKRYFGPISRGPVPPRPILPPIPAPGNLWLDVEARVTHPMATMAWRGPMADTPEDRAITVAAEALTASPGGLARRFVNDDAGALRITVREMSATAGSAFAVSIEPTAGVSLADLLPKVQAAIAAFPDQLAEVDLARLKKRMSDQRLLGLETSMGRALRLAGSHRGAAWGIDEYDRVDRASVVDSMRRFLAPEQRVTMVVRPATRQLFGVPAVLLHRDRMAR